MSFTKGVAAVAITAVVASYTFPGLLPDLSVFLGDERSESASYVTSETTSRSDHMPNVSAGTTTQSESAGYTATTTPSRTPESMRNNSLFRNNATSYYYREHISDDARAVYDAMLTLFEDPTDTSYSAVAQLRSPLTEDAASEVDSIAYMAMECDHPELFWVFNGLEGDVNMYFNLDQDGKVTSIRVQLERPYTNYHSEMTAFNDAVDRFMADIDLSASKSDIARQIHDKLIGMATYDHAVNEATKAGGDTDLAHTAYGALVCNSSGAPNHAVCSGYSAAYVYLLQQAGIEATTVHGLAGETSEDAETHAWNVINIDGSWYEVDSTWDDIERDWVISDYVNRNPPGELVGYFEAAFDDGAFVDRVTHAYYCISTEQMTNYSAGDTFTYYFDDGAWVYVNGDTSFHDRGTRVDDSSGGWGLIDELAPTSYGGAPASSYESSAEPAYSEPTYSDPYEYAPSSETQSSTTSTSSDQVQAPAVSYSGDYFLADSATREYTKAELEQLDNYSLYIARNEIFARHGCGFGRQDLRAWFFSKSWYVELIPAGTYGTEMLSSVEKHNALTMLEIEKERNSPYI